MGSVRTIRVVAFANGEQGLYGGRAYAEKHAPDVKKHQIGAESDFGAGRIYAYSSSLPDYAKAADRQIAQRFDLLLHAKDVGKDLAFVIGRAAGKDITVF